MISLDSYGTEVLKGDGTNTVTEDGWKGLILTHVLYSETDPLKESLLLKRAIFLKTNLLKHAVGKGFRTLSHLEDVVEQMGKINGNTTTSSYKCDPSLL